jgi:hypothetical protein
MPTPVPTEPPGPPPSPSTTLGGAVGEVARAVDAGPRRVLRVAMVAAATGAVLVGGALAWRARATAPAPAPTEPAVPVAAPAPAAVAPPPPAAPRRVAIRIVSQPTGAEIFRVLDGVRIGRTPWQGEYPATEGEAVYRLRAKGYRDAEVSLRLDADVEKSVTLEKIAHKASATPSPATPPSEGKPIKNGVVDPFAN